MADIGTLAGIAGGLLFTLLGLSVLALGPRRAANRAFAAFALANSLPGVIGRVELAMGASIDPTYALNVVLTLAGIVGLVTLALFFPEPISRRDRRSLLVAGGAFLVIFALTSVSLAEFTRTVDESPMFHVANWIFFVQESLLWSLLVLYALRFRARGAPRHTYALVSLAIVVLVAVPAGVSFLYPSANFVGFATAFLCVSIVAALWIANAALRPSGAPTYVVAWVVLLAATAGMLSETSTSGWDIAIASSRAAAAAVLGYAILRGHVPGIEAKARWGLSRGTTAAFFVAAFFVTSEVAQQFFNAQTGSVYVGIAATGILVFAIAPLQRAADRLANAAIPAGPPAHGTHEEVYRSAVRLAMRDRTLTRSEERDLVRLAESLGVGATRAMDIRDEVAREARAEPNGAADDVHEGAARSEP